MGDDAYREHMQASGFCPGCGAYVGHGHWSFCRVVRAILAFFEGLFALHDGPMLTAVRRGEVSGPVPAGADPPKWRGPPTVAQLLESASPVERAVVKGAFLEVARAHAPEWARLEAFVDMFVSARAALIGRSLPDVRRG